MQNKSDFFDITIKCIRYMLKCSKRKIMMWVLSSVIVSIIPSIIIVLNKKLINELSEHIFIKSVILILIIIGFLNIINSIFDTIKEYEYQSIKKETDYNLYKNLFMNLAETELQKFEDNNYYNKVSLAFNTVINNGIENVKYLIDIITNVITIVSVILVLYIAHWSLPFTLAISMVPGFVGIVIAKKKSYKNNVDLVESQRIESYISSLFVNKNILKEMRIFNISNYFIEKWSHIYSYVRLGKLKILKMEKITSIISNMIIQISTIGINIFLTFMIVGEKITVGDYVALTAAIVTFQSSIGIIIESIGEIIERKLYNASLVEIAENTNKSNINSNNTNNLEAIEKIELKNISFMYPNSTKECIDNLSLTINKGDKIAIVGSNGCGKSTLINIILGIYRGFRGNMIVNDSEIITDNNIKQYQEKFTVVFQDFVKYKFSIRENIGVGNTEKINNDEFIYKKIDEVNLSKKISKLSKKIDTRLSKEFENSTELSGGEWQKIAIARAISKDSDIIVFDEPTSALDPVSEIEIFKLLQNVSKDKTIIMISHRLGISKFADKIYYMKNGVITEEGSHEELINLNKDYKKMYESQAGWYK